MIEVRVMVVKVNKEEKGHLIENTEMIPKNMIKDHPKEIDLKFHKDKEVNFSFSDTDKTSMNKASEMFYQQNMEFYQANTL